MIPFNQMKFSIFLGLVFFILTILQDLSAKGIEERLNQLTLEERKSLEHFFSIAIKYDHLGHVLFFSNKPASLSGRNVSRNQSHNDVLFIEGWNVWNEKEHLFPHPNFLIFHEVVDFSNDRSVLHIYFINKKTLSNFFSKKEEFFSEIEDKKFTKEKFLTNLEKNNINSLFDADQTFVGLLLGYGIESSKAYKQHRVKKYPKPSTLEYILCTREGDVNVKKPLFNEGPIGSTLPHMICVMDKKVNVHPVSFLGDPYSKEVQMLQKKYAQERDEIESILEKNELLKIVLQALCEDH